MFKNKFENFSLSLAGALFVVAVVLGMKVKDDALEKENLKKAVSESAFDEKQFELQKEIAIDRAEIINKITNSPGEKMVEETAVVTTTPPPPVEIPAPVEKKKADKKTKTS